MLSEQLDYELPSRCIAREPASPRDSARLLVIRRLPDPDMSPRIEHHQVRDLPNLGVFQRGDLMVINESRVLPAYFEANRVISGGKVKGLFLSCLSIHHDTQWSVMFECRGKLRLGEHIVIDEDSALELVECTGGGQWRCMLHSPLSTMHLLQKVGRAPLPPYIRKARRLDRVLEIQPEDSGWYNTVYATQPGSVAAPTAGLHFTEPLLQAIADSGVKIAKLTLHVGLGTFNPIRCEQLDEHEMHSEWIDIPHDTVELIKSAGQTGGRIIAVGTTVVRAMESLPEPIEQVSSDISMDTDLFIHPESGFRFRFTDLLMTNFHLPRSTLLALVASLPGVGIDNLKRWYQLAVEADYRFYSYGDAMIIV